MLPPLSPATTTSISSSDTASTGSFFQDRSTSLGTLMGVIPPASFTFQHVPMVTDRDGGRRRRRRMRGWWWGLCRDGARRRSSASLAEFFEMERRFGEALCGGATGQLRGLVSAGSGERSGSRILRPRNREPQDGIPTAAGACRFPSGGFVAMD